MTRQLKHVAMATGLMAAFLATPAYADDHKGEERKEDGKGRAEINFADVGGIENWRADGYETVYIEGRNNKWYKAELMSRCNGLPFANTIAFATEPSGSLNKFSSIMVDGQECHFKSFERSDEPES